MGHHLRKRRLDMGLRQKDVAEQLGVNKDAIRNWEVGRAAPALWQWPALVRFLGYVPFSLDGSLPERLKAYRRLNGLSQKRLAAMLGVDPSTLARWEHGTGQPNRKHAEHIEGALSRGSARPGS